MSDISAYSAPSTSRPSDQYSHLPKLPQAICQFMLEQPGTAEGVHVSAIARAVGHIADAGKIRYFDSVLCFIRILLTSMNAARHWMASWTMVSSTQPLTTLTSNLQIEELYQLTYAYVPSSACIISLLLALIIILCLLLGGLSALRVA
jgi:hypothetical protein